MSSITLWLNDNEVDVEYSISGKYYPATFDDPAEYPECEIEAVYAYGAVEEFAQGIRPLKDHWLKIGNGRMDIRHLLNDDQMIRIEEQIWEAAEAEDEP